MKKFLILLVISFVLTMPVFAEGDILIGGGKSCPQGQACIAVQPDEFENQSIKSFKDFFAYLKSIFE